MPPTNWKKIEEIFEKVIELPASERDSVLAEMCGGDVALRAEVENLILADQEANDFIESPILGATTLANFLPDQLEDSVAPNSIGRRIGPYKIIRELGRGGMGAVFLAQRADDEFRQWVAIKLIKRGMDTDFILRRFRNERQILATLDHPNIARLLDGGTTEDGLPYFVMEFIEGEPINFYCDIKRLSIHERLELFQKLCSAVGYAHENKVIHRDLKPGNILVTKSGVPKLLDFGIAKLLDPEMALDTLQPTQTGMRLMTPEYASPEQIKGGDLTPASDIYALGVLLYEILTGKRPYNFPSRAPHEVARIVCEEEPENPAKVISSRQFALSSKSDKEPPNLDVLSRNRQTSPENLRRELGGSLQFILLKALRKSPENRYASADEFSADIQAYLDGMLTQAETKTLPPIKQTDEKINITQSSLKYFTPKNYRFIYAVVAGLLLILGGWYLVNKGILTVNIDNKPKVVETSPTPILTGSKSKAIAILPFKSDGDAVDEETLGVSIAESLYRRLGQIKELSVRPAMLNLAREQTPKEIGKSFGVAYVLSGKLHRAGDKIQISAELIDTEFAKILWAETFDDNMTDLQNMQVSISEKVLNALTVQLTAAESQRIRKNYTENSEAYQLYLLGRYQMANRNAENLNKAIKNFTKARDLDPKFTLAYAGLADAYSLLNLYQIPPPEDAYQNAKENALKAIELDDKLAESHASLGYVLFFYDRNRTEAEKELNRAIELNPSYSTAYHWFALMLSAMGRGVEAAAKIKTAMELEPRSNIIRTAAGLVNFYSRNYVEALAESNKVLESDAGFIPAHKTVRVVNEARGNYQEAFSAYQKERTFSGVTDENDTSWLMITAQVQAIGGKRDEALNSLKLATESADVKNNPKGFAYEIAIAYALLGETNQTVEWLKKSEAAIGYGFNFAPVDSRFDKVRNDPRFIELVQKLQPNS